MKITIAYLPGEEREAGIIEAFIKDHISGAKTRKSNRHTPFKHVYLTTTKPEKPSVPRTNA